MGNACASNPQPEGVPADNPVLYYLPIAARGEVVKMLCHTGGLELVDTITDGKDMDLKSFGSPSGLPVFQHGDLKLSQSHAIVAYVLNIAPKYRTMAPGHKAKDMQFNAIMDDVCAEQAKQIFGSRDKAEFGKVVDKWFPVLEGLIPASGFVNGLDYPTGADFVCVNLAKGVTPFTACYRLGGKDPEKQYPNFKALVGRTVAVPAVADWLSKSKTVNGNPFGL